MRPTRKRGRAENGVSPGGLRLGPERRGRGRGTVSQRAGLTVLAGGESGSRSLPGALSTPRRTQIHPALALKRQPASLQSGWDAALQQDSPSLPK